MRVVDLFTPLCLGQRVGVFAGSGVGKSSLLAMLARARRFDTVVIALVGERGREVREFLRRHARRESRSSAVAVVSTGDESPMMRRLAPKTAMAVAEYFRDQGESVLLIVNSVTRFAHAARDVALAAGEPAVARGYAPSVFSDLPRLLERAGPGVEGSGSITGVFSVLVDGDDHNDPVADAIRGTLDGHIVLDRAIADEGRYPAVNILSSVSRLAHPVWTPEQRKLVANLRSLIARFEETRELRLMGGYTAGADPILDKAIKSVPRIYEAMNQAARRAAVRGSVHRSRRRAARRRQDPRNVRPRLWPLVRKLQFARSERRWPASRSRSPSICSPMAGGGRASTASNIWRSSPSRAATRRSVAGRGSHPAGRGRRAAVDMATTGSFAVSAAKAAPERAADRDRRRPRGPRLAEDRRRDPFGGSRRQRAGVGRIGAIVARDGGWALLDDKGATLLAVTKGANGAALFARKRIFE